MDKESMDKARKELIQEQKDKLLRDVSILDEMLSEPVYEDESTSEEDSVTEYESILIDDSLPEEDWDSIVEDFYSPQNMMDNLTDGLTDEEMKKQLEDL